jgi:hypothetical protein
MRAIVKLNFLSFQELATRIDAPQDTLTRIIRYCITNGVLIE